MKSKHWIFIRGLTRGNIHWGNFPEKFTLSDPEICIEFLEIPGNGTRSSETTPLNVIQLVHLLKTESKFCQQNIPINICGISLGGMIALKWGELYPENIQSIYVINSSIKQLSPFYQRLIPTNYPQILWATLFGSVRTKESIILKMTSNRYPNETKQFLPIFIQAASKNPISNLNAIRQIILASLININKISPNIQLNFIVSKEDHLVSHHCTFKLHQSFGGSLKIHPSAGHDLPLDDPDWLITYLKNV